ncbi:hypothetical protein [Bacillus sp. JCM 19041]|uniref:hypothetical protein n=1 Tax=Bacillus sp. JCM 19041 TaxID=1460637 RepID=UPI00336AC61F
MHLCESCAREKGESIPGTDSFSIHHLFSGLFNMETNEQMASAQKNKMACPNCGMSYEKFLHVGRFGCGSCYETFSTKLSSVFKRVHGGNVKHVAKYQSELVTLFKLKNELKN